MTAQNGKSPGAKPDADSDADSGGLPGSYGADAFVLVPREPSEALLRAFYECPPEELSIAWNAMLYIAERMNRRSQAVYALVHLQPLLAHVRDLEGAAVACDDHECMSASAAEFRKAASEIRALIATAPQTGGAVEAASEQAGSHKHDSAASRIEQLEALLRQARWALAFERGACLYLNERVPAHIEDAIAAIDSHLEPVKGEQP